MCQRGRGVHSAEFQPLSGLYVARTPSSLEADEFAASHPESVSCSAQTSSSTSPSTTLATAENPDSGCITVSSLLIVRPTLVVHTLLLFHGRMTIQAGRRKHVDRPDLAPIETVYARPDAPSLAPKPRHAASATIPTMAVLAVDALRSPSKDDRKIGAAVVESASSMAVCLPQCQRLVPVQRDRPRNGNQASALVPVGSAVFATHHRTHHQR